MKSIANQSLPREAELFSRLAPDSTQLRKCQCGGEGEEKEGRKILAIDQSSTCDAHIRNVFTLTALLGWQAVTIIPQI